METTETRASVSQRLLWMIKHYREDFGALNCPVVCRLTGPLDPDRLHTALGALAARHESLRTTFHGRGARLVQRVHPPGEPEVTWHEVASAQAATEALTAELRTRIDPERWPARVTVWRQGPDEHLLCLNLHHLVTDAWSTGILLRDLVACYDRAAGGSATLPAPGWSAARFARAQQEMLGTDRLGRHQQYWRRQLAGARVPRLDALGITEGASRSVAADLPATTVTTLRELALRERTTMFAVLLALFHAQLYRTTDQDDLAVASMFANRDRPELRETVGLLAGMVLLRARPGRAHRFTDLLREVHGTVIGAFTHQELPFQLLPGDLVDTGGGRADDVMFNVMTPVRHRLSAGDVHFELVVPTEIGSRFPFELALAPVGEQRLQAVLFQAGDGTAAADFLAGYVELATAVAAEPGLRLSRVSHAY
ncbi:condensation domain-containing protein [Micromonospora sp. R77]|uniref:condensation domain-containing protein n=1 Tax=Micromonospora sp. R77 TaxID=2925836 RepID=UPI001F61D3DC|nr:condensation domain-containing protein [Micromonospora sp. R77]MCI4066424.1 condensation domain-containing protein [Micromonospora sp. R77]